MLARVTYGLVGLALATLIAGFFTSESNVLLYISIGLSLAAIVLVLVGAARRAREVPAADLATEAFDDEEVLYEDEEEVPDDVLAAFDDLEDEEDEEEDDEELEDEEYEDEEFEDEDEEFEDEEDWEYDDEESEEEEEEPEPAPRRRAAATKTKSKARNKVLVLEGRDRFHSPDCRFVRDKDDDELEEITKATAKRRGYEPCSVCSPD